MDQENNNLDGGACAGEEHLEHTSVKLVPPGFFYGETGIPIEDERPLVSGYHNSSSSNAFSVDVDLTNERENNKMERKSNKTYMVEKACEQAKNPSMSPMPLNIPVPDECKKGSSDQEGLTMAERQHSFQTMCSGGENYPAMLSLNSEDNTQVNGKVTSPGNNAVVTSLTGATPGFPMRIGNDNNSNDNSSMRSMAPNNLAQSQHSNTSNTSGSSNATSGSKYSQRRMSRITDDTLVANCPRYFITLLATHFDGRGGKNWEALLGHYHWTYRDIRLFANKDHPLGCFCSILEEPDFQQFTVGQLRDDLDEIPKRDTLKHINEWIDDYNAMAD